MNNEEANEKRAGEVGQVGQGAPAAEAARHVKRIEKLRANIAEIDAVLKLISDMQDKLTIRLRRIANTAVEVPFCSAADALASMEEYMTYRKPYDELDEVRRLELLQRKEWHDEMLYLETEVGGVEI